MKDYLMFSQSFIWTFQNKKNKITIIFPEVRDKKAEQDFFGYLKDIYLRKEEKSHESEN